jgi:L-aminopeptidase/D-esterase-like protein
MHQAMKGGLGSATVALEGDYAGVLVSALAAVNAFGDVVDPRTGDIVAGARRAPDSREFADTERVMKQGRRGGFRRQNTTLAVVATNARLSKVEARKVAQLGNLGLARTVRPANTMFDGDIVFALSLGDKAADVNVIGLAAADAVSQAILRAVRLAPSLGGVPGLAATPPSRSGL